MAVAWKKFQYNDPRITSIASSATPTPNADTTDLYLLTALAEAATFGVPAGTPKDGQKLLIRILDDGTARSLSWNAIYVGDNLPDTTVISTIMYLACIYNSAASKWDTVVADKGAVTAAANLTANALVVGDDGAKGVKALALGTAALQVINLKPAVNGDVNKLDVFSKSGGAAFDATNYLTVSIPDGNGYTSRTRNGAVASGTGQIILADAANYWSKGSLDAEIKTAYLYAIWSAADGGIVFALCGYSGFTRCPASTTATDDDYMHLEASSSYTPVVTDYCVVIAKIRYQYDAADAPDHTIQATVLNAPQVCWNPKSDYGYQKNLATTVTSAGDIAEYSAISVVVKQSGLYIIHGKGSGYCVGGTTEKNSFIKTGSATYGNATQKSRTVATTPTAAATVASVVMCVVYINVGDTIHLGENLTGASGNRVIYGDNTIIGITSLIFQRTD